MKAGAGEKTHDLHAGFLPFGQLGSIYPIFISLLPGWLTRCSALLLAGSPWTIKLDSVLQALVLFSVPGSFLDVLAHFAPSFPAVFVGSPRQFGRDAVPILENSLIGLIFSSAIFPSSDEASRMYLLYIDSLFHCAVFGPRSRSIFDERAMSNSCSRQENCAGSTQADDTRNHVGQSQ